MESKKGRKKRRHTQRDGVRAIKRQKTETFREKILFRIWVDSETGHLFNFLRWENKLRKDIFFYNYFICFLTYRNMGCLHSNNNFCFPDSVNYNI